MNVYLNRIDGLDDAILSMFLSKRTLNRQLEQEIRVEVSNCSNKFPTDGPIGAITGITPQMHEYMEKLVKWGVKHNTLLRFLDFSFTVYGIHRAGQDDLDSHAARYNSRIVRSSTRLADFNSEEMSEYYQDKIIPTDVALTYLGITTPDEIQYDGKTYVRAENGYILKGMEDNRDVKRGLYMLCLPSNFIFRCNCTEWAHVYKMRNAMTTANPEVQTAIEQLQRQIEDHTAGIINRGLLMRIPN